MRVASEVELSALTSGGARYAVLRIALLPGAADLPPPLVEDPSRQDPDMLASVQLLEGHEYLYEWVSLPSGTTSVRTEPQEVFQPDALDGIRGRLRTGLSTGSMTVEVQSDNGTVAQLEVEVRSRKLHYLTEYRWMLRDIAQQMTELLMDRFAASGMRFAPSAKGDARTLYQRFAFLRALITSEGFQIALGEIVNRPHVAWISRSEPVRPGQCLKAASQVMRQLRAPGRRVSWPDGPVSSMPASLERSHTEATHDTAPNRFVRFAFEQWRQVISSLDRGLAQCASTPTTERGRREVSRVLQQIDEILNYDLFKEAGLLLHFPANNQVLHRKEGYRDVFRAYLEFELAAQLSWDGAESTYTAGQRDVATLYEYWAFVQIAQLVAELAGRTFDIAPLIATGRDGLSVALKMGKETVVSGEVVRHGRRLSVDLCFNRTFSAGVANGSWTRSMRPDYSLVIQPAAGESAGFEPVVVHFDAKYRVNFKDDLFGLREDRADATEPIALESVLQRGGALRADLLKMHAYRDAIRRSAGAYVIYPGEDETSHDATFREYHELLPGLGAFALRPSESGVPSGSRSLRKFLSDLFDHVAARLTNHERGRFWLEEVYGSYRLSSPSTASTLPFPPVAETRVLLGYVKNRKHWEWICSRKTYNVRTEGRPGGVSESAALLYSQLLLLYSPDLDIVAMARIVSSPERVSKEAIELTGYPSPSSDYWCIQIAWLPIPSSLSSLNTRLISTIVQRKGGIPGEPTAVDWRELEDEGFDVAP